MEDSAVVGVDEVVAPIAHGDPVCQGVGALRKWKDDQGGSPARNEPPGLPLFEAGGHLGRRQAGRGVHVDARVQGAEQRDRDAAGVELARDAGAK